jgi:quercetin dioxygenase-like cupin family protein
MSTHLPDQADFRPTLPEDIDWQPFPPFPPSARLAVVVGHPSQAAPYVVRVKLPSGVKLMPHRHHEDRVYTVMSGVFYIGLGEQFDDGKLQAYPPGAVIVLPAGTPHFHWAKSGEYVTREPGRDRRGGARPGRVVTGRGRGPRVAASSR